MFVALTIMCCIVESSKSSGMIRIAYLQSTRRHNPTSDPESDVVHNALPKSRKEQAPKSLPRLPDKGQFDLSRRADTDC